MTENKLNTTTITTTTDTRDLLRNLEEYPREPFNNIILRIILFFKEHNKEE